MPCSITAPGVLADGSSADSSGFSNLSGNPGNCDAAPLGQVSCGSHVDADVDLGQAVLLSTYAVRMTRKMFGWARRDLNPGPRDYESPALTAELQARLLELDLHLAKSLVQCLVRRRGGNFYAAAEDAGKVVRKRLC